MYVCTLAYRSMQKSGCYMEWIIFVLTEKVFYKMKITFSDKQIWIAREFKNERKWDRYLCGEQENTFIVIHNKRHYVLLKSS